MCDVDVCFDQNYRYYDEPSPERDQALPIIGAIIGGYNSIRSKDRFLQDNKAVQITGGYARLDNLTTITTTASGTSSTTASSGQCLMQPSLCENGLSLAVWAKVTKLPTRANIYESVCLITTGVPKYSGAGIFFAFAGEKKYQIIFEVNDGREVWTSTVNVNSTVFQNVWRNYGLTWSKKDGIYAFLDGKVIRMLTYIT